MGLKMKNFNIFGVYWNMQFSRVGRESRKTNMKRGDCLKRWAWTVCWFKGGLLRKREGGFLRRVVDTPMHTMSSQNNLKVTTDSYERKCLLVITKNKKHSSKQVVPITYTLEKGSLLLPLFKVCGWFVFRQSEKYVWYTLLCLSLPCISRGQ